MGEDPDQRGGATGIANGQGLFQACNHAKHATGWSHHVQRDGGITTRTPTGHDYRSELPDPPGDTPRRGTSVELDFARHLDLLRAA